MFVDRKIDYCKSSAIVIIILLLIGSFEHVFSKLSSSGVPRNLNASVFEDTRYILESEGHGPLKLNITWDAPLASRKPSSYSILITTQPKHDEANAESCPEETLFHTTWNINSCYVVLPENQFLSDAPELSIRPTCLYRIQVSANPRVDPKLQVPEIVLTVPECVGRWCGCEDAKVFLPVPIVNVILKNSRDVMIEWKTTIDHRIRSYVISFGVPFLISNKQLPVFNITRITTVPSTISSFLWSVDKTEIDKTFGIQVYVAAEDAVGCVGSSGTASMNPPVEALKSIQLSSHGLIWLSLLGLATVILAGFASFFYVQKFKKYQIILGNRTIPRIQDLMELPRLGSHWVDSTLRERNVLYVEQEIQDAMNQGLADELEVSYERLKFIRELGKGQFGKVYLGTLEGYKDSVVAIKISNCYKPSTDLEARQQLLTEIETMKNAGYHSHLVRLIATCTLPKKPICVILEYLEGGDLLAHLRRIRDFITSDKSFGSRISSCRSERPSISETVYTTVDNYSPTLGSFSDYPIKCEAETTKKHEPAYVNIAEDSTYAFNSCNDVDGYRFMSFALDIARGMDHLESKGIIHRDLAARNILLSADLTLKISDFGLSRNDGVYIIGNGVRRLPLRWMAPEALRDRAFTSKSDVWSFGIVLWEIGTLGAFPYSNIQDDHLLQYILRDEGRLAKPDNFSTDIYRIMQLCWVSRPEERPSFGQLIQCLLNFDEPSQLFNATSNPCYSLFPTTQMDDSHN